MCMNRHEDQGNHNRRSSSLRIQRGQRGESFASQYLIEQGYTILSQNWRTKYGELDVVATLNNQLVVVEVRTRAIKSLSSFGIPEESITLYKQNKLRKLALLYMQRFPALPRSIHFDCIFVIINEQNECIKISHLKDAF
jgi:putative endonuclease